jgi:class 3 adenylate cyclase
MNTQFSIGFGLLALGVVVLVIILRCQRRNLIVEANFAGLVNLKRLNRLKWSRKIKKHKLREQPLTMMFIDISGFSLAAERENPQRLFYEMHSYMRFLQKIVHKHGGVIERYLGDGLLCYFGYDFVSQRRDHANRALKCASEIQRANLKRCQAAAAEGRQVYPLRIGINSGTVLLGNLGEGLRLDFCLVGHAVNFAKRMEQCCENFKIMISATTKELLQNFDQKSVCINKKLVQVKHAKGPIDAYEYDPLVGKGAETGRVLAKFRESLGIVRKEERQNIAHHSPVRVYTEFGEGDLVDHSFSGLGIRLRSYLASGSEVSLTFDSGTKLGATLLKHGICEIKGKVRWSRPEAGRVFVHGLAIKNLSQRQMMLFRSLLTDLGPSSLAA